MRIHETMGEIARSDNVVARHPDDLGSELTDNGNGFAPRMVATDIDGTIVPHGGTVSARTRNALLNCVDAGIEVVYVTGRPPRWMPPVVAATELDATAICANGSIVIDTSDFSVLDITTIPTDTSLEMISLLQRAVPDIVFAAEVPSVLRAGPGYEEGRSGGRRAEGLAPAERSVIGTGSLAQMLDAPVFKLVGVSNAATPDELLAIARTAVGHLASVTHSSEGRALVELGPLGMSKATTLARHAARLGIRPDEVIAFGDMPNDVEMLAWAGRGYAMTGAHPEAVAAASFTAPAAADDGVAQILEALLAERVAVA